MVKVFVDHIKISCDICLDTSNIEAAPTVTHIIVEVTFRRDQ